VEDEPVRDSQTIRVIYRWRVDRHRWDAFATWWHEGTLRIRASHPGALGSTLCHPAQDDEHLVGIARWKSEDDLVRFWGDNVGNPQFPGAVLESTEILAEVDNMADER
jgi:Antibiotic biosynthesis monooxygenase